MTDDSSSLTHAFAVVDEGVRLHYVTAGDGPLVVLLHGFPDFWFTWSEIIPRLVHAGFRVVAPDMRGYNLSDKPAGVRAYAIERLVADVDALIRALGEERAHVVGHDWGGGVAWMFAAVRPERLRRLVILNAPHPTRLLAAMKSPKQLAKSWYMFAMQPPWLPEAILRRNGYEVLVRALRDELRRPPSEAELERYREAFAQPGALTAMINYYRAMFRSKSSPRLKVIEAPVLVIWGDDDPHLGRELAVPPPERVPHARVERLPEATHWVHRDDPEHVASLILEFLREG